MEVCNLFVSAHNCTHTWEFRFWDEPDLRDFGGGLSIVAVGRLPKGTFDRIHCIKVRDGRCPCRKSPFENSSFADERLKGLGRFLQK
jgi:hypothetical protein